MKLVVVSQRIDLIQDHGEVRDSLDHRLVRLLLTAGYLPFPVPNSVYCKNSDRLSEVNNWLRTLEPHGIVLSGGNDIGEFRERDLTEHIMLDYACDLRLPVLGICRGMQMIGHWAGVGVVPVDGHISTRHRISGKISSEVNSYHAYALEECPENFEVIARSEDGQIEAISHLSLPWEGWMWHPERDPEIGADNLKRIKELFL